MSGESVGFVGLGSIGAPMAARFVSAGYGLIGFDVSDPTERLPEGAELAASAGEVTARTRVVFMSLPDGEASRSVCSEIAEAKDGRAEIVVDLSTIGVAAAQECAGILRESGMTYVDAPVSGGVPGAKAGTLAVMVGAEAEVFEEIRPLLEVIAKNLFRMGDDPGNGQAMKLLNNFLSATALVATSEAVLFGSRAGLEMEKIIDVLNVSTGRNTASTDKFPKSIIPRTFDHGFASALMKKDLDLYLESVEDGATRHDVASAVVETWRAFDKACPGRDFTYVYKYLEDLS